MLDNDITIQYAGSAVALKRVNQQNFSSEYFGENGNDRISLQVKHTVPSTGKSGESHLVRLNVEHYDVDGTLVRVTSAWDVIKTTIGIQSATDSENTAAALASVLTPAFRTAIVGRES